MTEGSSRPKKSWNQQREPPKRFSSSNEQPKNTFSSAMVESKYSQPRPKIAKQQIPARQRIDGPKTPEMPPSPSCFCGGKHFHDKCTNYETVDQRFTVLRKKKCFKCLRGKHQASECKRILKCRQCKRAHPTALCRFKLRQNGPFHPTNENKKKGETIVYPQSVNQSNGTAPIETCS